jgi:hypothetical protein
MVFVISITLYGSVNASLPWNVDCRPCRPPVPSVPTSEARARARRHLPLISAATLMLVDISAKTSNMLAAEHSVEPIFGFLSLLQSVISFVVFDQPFKFCMLSDTLLQTYDYFMVSIAYPGTEFTSVSRVAHRIFGSNHFVKLTIGHVCREADLWVSR